GRSGRLKIDAERLSGGLDGLAKLLDSSSAHGGVDLRLRGSEQQVLSAGQVLKADDIALAFDQAGVEIHGQLDASGKRGGSIDVQANGDVFIGAGAGLLARGSENRGGDVRVSSHGGALSFAAGSTVDVSGGEGGDVVFRADIDDTRGVNIGDAGFAGSIIGARRARLEVHDTPYLDNGTFDQADADALRARAQAIQATADSIRARLLVDEQVDIVSSLEVVSQGAYNWSQEVNFDEWQSYTDTGTLADGSVLAGTLTVKATGNLSMLGGLSDGFNTEGLLSTQDSWSYRLVAGADLAAANALHTAVSQANFVVGKDTKIRTGNGRIDIASANDFSLTNRNSVVYSAGRNTGLVLDPNDALVFGIAGEKVVAAEGGHVSITAGHDLKGHAPAKGNGVRVQAWTDWLQDNGAVAEEVLIDPETGEPLIDAETGGYYYMRVQEDAGRFVNYAAFAQGIAAIGGGNLSLVAGQDIVRLDASLPTTIAVSSQTGLRTETGAGQLRVHAAGDVISSHFLIGEGEGSVTALGSIRAERTLADGRVAAGYTALAGGDFRYSARKDVTLLGAFDLSSVNHLFADGMDSSAKYYFSMDGDTAFSAMSIAGNLDFNTTLSAAQRNLFDLQGENLFASGPYSQDKIVPADFTLAALSGKTSVENLLSFAQADSTLVLWASDSLFLKSGVTLMDVPLAELPTLENPESPKGGGFDPRQGVQVSSLSALENEESNILLVATDGSVSMPSVFRSALPVDVFAAQDIDRINMVATHYDETDVSRFTAGRDIKLVSGAERISVAGPGRVDVMAGRNINLGSSKGIETVGATTNRQLQGREGADLFVFAGVRSSDLQYDSFIVPLLDNRSSMNSFATQVQSYVALVTTEKLSERDASERFRSLTLAQ
ncbi:MAG TPA: hypothetical protein VFX11_03540, partial [Candidatus Kapabacteria bacterium]|nr:hypothetical protein [Candidatus Kapabacteria bacterium]